MAASGVPQIPPVSWSVSLWAIDFANSTGCAADSNSGTSTTCGAVGSGIGPLLTVGQLYSRWGTHSPTLNPGTGTTIYVLSSQASSAWNTDPWGVFSPSCPNGSCQIIGTLQAVGSTFVGSTVTQISRANPGNDFEVLLGAAGAAAATGQILYDSTAGGYCVIDSLTGSGGTLTAVCTAPFTAASVTTPKNAPAPVADGASWLSGDTLQLYTRPIIYMDTLSPQLGTSAANGGANVSGMTWVQSIQFGSPSGTGSSGIASNFTIAAAGGFTCSLCSFDAIAIVNAASSGNALDLNQQLISPFGLFETNASSGNVVVYGGSDAPLVGNPIFFGVTLKNDTILHGGPQFYPGIDTITNAHLVSGTMTVIGASALRIVSGGTAAALWGGGTVEVYQGNVVVNTTGNTWANEVIVNALKLSRSGFTVGCAPYDGGAGNSPSVRSCAHEREHRSIWIAQRHNR